ncbi:MAG: PrgI family protein [bacterium]|nr:PrgI family protein [bacterium]
MKFQVPQFIEVEDKIFGPLTIKQFIYLAGGGGLAFIVYRFSPLPFFITLFLIIPVILLALALAFYKVNNKSFIAVLEAAIKYFFGNKLYIWKKTPKTPEHREKDEKEEPTLFVHRLSDSKLKDLTWSLDIAENVNLGANESMGKNNANTTK